jgi:anti-sigma factor RsiW
VTTCPDDQTLAAFVDGQLAESSRDETTVHLDTCAVCFDRVAAIANAAGTSAFVSPQLVRAATTSSRGLPGWRTWVPAGAVAAGVLLGVAMWRPSLPVVTPESQNLPSGPVRSRDAAVVTPVVEVPRDDEPLAAGFEVRWRAPESAVFVEVKLTTAGGDVLWSTEVQGAVAHLEVPVAPPADAIAYLWVTAHLPEGRKVSSNVVKIRGMTRR